MTATTYFNNISNATTGSNNISIGTVAWSGTGNISVSDNSYADVYLMDSEQSYYLNASGFGFSIPNNAIIIGITVSVEKDTVYVSDVVDGSVRIIRNGTIGSVEEASSSYWPATDTWVDYGNGSYLWGETWTSAEINDNRFGVAISCYNAMGSTRCYIDNIRITIDYAIPIPTLFEPTNASSNTKPYPPLTSDINFTWESLLSFGSNIVIAKDVNFNLIAVDTTTANNYSVQSLEADEYWWKVQYYNSSSGTFYNWSAVFNFTLSSNTQTTSGTAIQGTVSELINGAYVPLDSVTVYIQSSAANWSSSMVTGTNGYYLFDGLSNTTTYYVYASKTEYTTSTAEYVTTGSGTWTTKNILLKKTEPTDFESDKQYVKFKARWLWCFINCDIQGATISAYKSGDVVAYASGVTDTTGSISFRLYKAQLYRVTVVNATAGISQEMTLYPKDTEYIFLITNTEPTMQEHPVQEKDAITISVSKATINTTHATITINYTDILAGTTGLTYYINQTNSTVASWTWAAGTYNHTFTISGYSGQSYLVRVIGQHSTYGTIDRSYAVPFEKSGVGIADISNTVWLWFAIIIMFFTAAMFTNSTAEQGLLIICAEGWIFFFMGMFSSLGSAQFAIGLTLASVIGVMAYIKRSQAREGYA